MEHYILFQHEEQEKHSQDFLSQYQDDVYRVTRSLPDIKCKVGNVWERWPTQVMLITRLRYIAKLGSEAHKKLIGAVTNLEMFRAWCLVNEPLEWAHENSRVDPSEDFVALQLIHLANVEEWRHVKFVGQELGDALSDLRQLM